ncbi:hypothetical protein DPEC_G00121560 [Dallia pectoralis]|uniref:Uncharacterized protein n=1 Tax=Dallia pectoralis TaxID=75939 RepID=A0ACC2GQ89_DALPE|nr:hypothetical protein DPEC_G00121560 [Dallia pectoralis]
MRADEGGVTGYSIPTPYTHHSPAGNLADLLNVRADRQEDEELVAGLTTRSLGSTEEGRTGRTRRRQVRLPRTTGTRAASRSFGGQSRGGSGHGKLKGINGDRYVNKEREERIFAFVRFRPETRERACDKFWSVSPASPAVPVSACGRERLSSRRRSRAGGALSPGPVGTAPEQDVGCQGRNTRK